MRILVLLKEVSQLHLISSLVRLNRDYTFLVVVDGLTREEFLRTRLASQDNVRFVSFDAPKMSELVDVNLVLATDAVLSVDCQIGRRFVRLSRALGVKVIALQDDLGTVDNAKVSGRLADRRFVWGDTACEDNETAIGYPPNGLKQSSRASGAYELILSDFAEDAEGERARAVFWRKTLEMLSSEPGQVALWRSLSTGDPANSDDDMVTRYMKIFPGIGTRLAGCKENRILKYLPTEELIASAKTVRMNSPSLWLAEATRQGVPVTIEDKQVEYPTRAYDNAAFRAAVEENAVKVGRISETALAEAEAFVPTPPPPPPPLPQPPPPPTPRLRIEDLAIRDGVKIVIRGLFRRVKRIVGK